jgi:Lsr2
MTMAEQVQQQLIDDLDGSTATQTVRFGYAGRSYEIDLNAEHVRELDQALAPYLAHARHVNAAKQQPRGRRTGASRRSETPQPPLGSTSEPGRPANDPDRSAPDLLAADVDYAAAPGGPEQVSPPVRHGADSEVAQQPSSDAGERAAAAGVGPPYWL